MEKLVQLLKKQQLTIGSCESMSAGLFASMMAEIPGVSTVLKGAIVTYQTSVKTSLVGVEQTCVDTYGVISEETALAMAQKTRILLDCDICVSCSGNAGPDVMEAKPAGYVCCAIVSKLKQVTFILTLHGTRNEIRQRCVDEMVKKLELFVQM